MCSWSPVHAGWKLSAAFPGCSGEIFFASSFVFRGRRSCSGSQPEREGWGKQKKPASCWDRERSSRSDCALVLWAGGKVWGRQRLMPGGELAVIFSWTLHLWWAQSWQESAQSEGLQHPNLTTAGWHKAKHGLPVNSRSSVWGIRSKNSNHSPYFSK